MRTRNTSSTGGGDPATAARIRDAAIDRFDRDGFAAGLPARPAGIERSAPITLYVVRSLREGGDLAVELFEDMIDDATRYLEAGVEAGAARPSRRPSARPCAPTLRR